MLTATNKGPATIGRNLEPKTLTEEGGEFEEDPTKGETVGAQFADGLTILAVVDVTTFISGPKTSAEERWAERKPYCQWERPRACGRQQKRWWR